METMSNNVLQCDLEHILKHTKDVWECLRNQKIFITGGTGFIGAWMLESFAYANHVYELNAEAVVLTRNLEVFKDKAPHLAESSAIKFCVGDVRDFIFPEGNFRYIIHAATEASAKLNDENPLLMFDTIVAGTRRCLDFSIKTNAEKILYLSSGAVYGKQPLGITHINEEYMGTPDSTDPRSSYGIGKRTAELLCALYSTQYGLHVNIARCFAFVGPYLPLNTHFAIGNFIRDSMKGGPVVVNGDGAPYRSYLYSSDLAIWLWTILMKGDNCRPYNVGSEESMSIAQVAQKVAQLIGNVQVNILLKPSPNKSPERYVPSTKRLSDEMGLEQTVLLDEAILKTARWNGWTGC